MTNFHFHINGIIHYLSFCERLVSLSLMSSGFIHGTTHEGVSFLHDAELYSITCMYHTVFNPLMDTWVAFVSKLS